MSGETDLNTILASMRPSVGEARYVFLCEDRDSPAHLHVRPLMTFEEQEGRTCIVTQEQASEIGRAGSFPSRLITLNVHSSLEAVGLIARIATALATQGISVNPVAAFYHDHLFVPEQRIADAMRVLSTLSERAVTAIAEPTPTQEYSN
jgi:hypothetical protein